MENCNHKRNGAVSTESFRRRLPLAVIVRREEFHILHISAIKMAHLQQNKYTYHILCGTDIYLIYFKLIYGGRQSDPEPRSVGRSRLCHVWCGYLADPVSRSVHRCGIILFTTFSYLYIYRSFRLLQ